MVTTHREKVATPREMRTPQKKLTNPREKVATPRERVPDSTLGLIRDGYRFISNRCEQHHSDIFEARLLLKPTICMRGRDAAELFYDPERFERHGAAPGRGRRTLLGVGGAQGLDGAAHGARKRLLMSLMTPERIADLGRLTERRWRERVPAWQRAGRVVLYDEVGWILSHAVHEWAGMPLAEHDLRARTDELHAMIEGAGQLGIRHLRARQARVSAERRIGGLVQRVRRGALEPPVGSALRVIAEHRDHEGRLLDPRIAAVELLNILRPTVAVGRYITFTALALHSYPDRWSWLATSADGAELFVQEVRRFYPFFPVTAARTRTAFDWRGHHFPRGRRVLLDLYGTNHHPDLWPDPDEFRPERFRDWDGDPFSFIPQGGGEYFSGHRCAGEWITIELMKRGLTALTGAMLYDVPAQDLRISLREIPTLPRSGFVITGVRPGPDQRPV